MAGGFTLVELLVVIGIIALLISLLLPALGKARAQAQKAACLSNLHQIGLAFQVHASTHKGYYPAAGLLQGCGPLALDDTYRQKYDYGYLYGIAPVSTQDPTNEYQSLVTPVEALSIVMGSKLDRITVTTDAQVAGYYARINDSSGFIKAFLCPAHTSDTTSGIFSSSPSPVDEYDDQFPVQMFGDIYGVGGYYGSAPSSYIWSGYVLGWPDSSGLPNTTIPNSRLRGKASAVHHAESTFLAGDGFGTADAGGLYGSFGAAVDFVVNTGVGPSLTMPAAPGTSFFPVTLNHCYAAGDVMATGGPSAFDLKRHGGFVTKNGVTAGMTNILFCDGHGESKQITDGDLSTVYLVPPSP